MKVIKFEVTNFGSYEKLDFIVSNLGLALIHGPTGSGKSTLQDIIPWILYGVTAKGGTVDEVRSWTALDKPTTGIVTILLNDKTIKIGRVRGKQPENDLVWIENDNEIRGKDIKETQKIINNKLGLSNDSYLLSSYFHEFSSLSLFFSSNSKIRRDIFNEVIDLSLSIKLQETLSNEKKKTIKVLESLQRAVDILISSTKHMELSNLQARRSSDSWEIENSEHSKRIEERRNLARKEKQRKLSSLIAQLNLFEMERAEKLRALASKKKSLVYDIEKANSDKCPTCGNSKDPIDFYKRSLKETINEIDQVNKKVNQFITMVEEEEASPLPENGNYNDHKNPFLDIIVTNQAKLVEYKDELSEKEKTTATLISRLQNITQLLDLVANLRGTQTSNTLNRVTSLTNDYLSNHFECSIRLITSIDEQDAIEVQLEVNGHECSYTQLSKGQRGLLKLCFGVAMMKAASDKSGIHPNVLFFDEALDGLDADLKIKSFGLFQSLEIDYESIFLIDHQTELKTMFNRQFEVTLIGDKSIIKDDKYESEDIG